MFLLAFLHQNEPFHCFLGRHPVFHQSLDPKRPIHQLTKTKHPSGRNLYEFPSLSLYIYLYIFKIQSLFAFLRISYLPVGRMDGCDDAFHGHSETTYTEKRWIRIRIMCKYIYSRNNIDICTIYKS